MSGIVGIIYFHGRPVEPGQVEAMTTAMRSRGPDGINHWRRDHVALGQCMLRTTPESLAETQPLTSEDESLVLVIDGRLDNRDEVKRELLAARIALRDNTDAELVLGSYQLWGEDSPRHLLGEFAYAVWDRRGQKLFCAVDQFSARPFYFAMNKQFFAFASEEEALVGLPGVSGQPREELIAQILVPAFQSIDNQRFWLRDVDGLRPGQHMTVFADRTCRTQTYWKPESGRETVYTSDEECEEAFLDVFGEAVRCRLRVIGEPAMMMSGGMDSAGIAAMVRRVLPAIGGKRLRTYSAIADDPAKCVESRCIQSLTGSAETDAFFVSVPSFQGMVDARDLMESAWSRAHPCDNSILLQLLMCKAASRQGDRVLLHGLCGDVTMHVPYRYPTYLLKAGQWLSAWEECKSASRNNTYLRGTSPISLFLKSAAQAYSPNRAQALAWRFRWRTSLAQASVNPGFVGSAKLVERLRHQEEETRRRLENDIQQDHLQFLMGAIGLELALTGLNRVGARYGVELRDPWADRRVVEFFLRLPIKYKVRDGWTKHLARTAFKSELNQNVLQRLGKEHLGWHFIVRAMDESPGFVSRTFEAGLGCLEKYLDVDAVRVRYESYKRYGNDVDRLFVYELVTAILWLQRVNALK